MSGDNQMKMEELLGRIGGLTRALLAEGADAAELAFALTSVAADMGLKVTGDPFKVIPVLLSAIADQASNRVETNSAEAGANIEAPAGVTVH
jgi:hypothetical protein